MRTGQNILNQGLLRSPEVTAHREGRGALLTRTLWFLETRDHRETHTRKGLSTFAFLKSYLWLCRVFTVARGLSPGAVSTSPLQSWGAALVMEHGLQSAGQ